MRAQSETSIEQAARLRAVRADEDGALAVVNARTAAVQRARVRRDGVLARHDAGIARAEAELGEAIDALIRVAGAERAARILGMPRASLRRRQPPQRNSTTGSAR